MRKALIGESVSAGIDEIKGINKYSAAQQGNEVVYQDPHARKRRRSSAQATTPGATAEQTDSVREKPQKYFEDKIDNSHAPFVSKFEASSSTPRGHPFAAEIAGLGYVPAQLMIAPGEEQKYLPLDSIPCTWVDTENKLKEVVKALEAPGVLEIAIDLEAHNYRSFQGFVCLMQISTRDEDWLVDTIALRSHMQLLSAVFTDATKVKVLHGADSDIVWLQRDFGLYIVNMFDTGQASRVLELQRFSLAYLYKRYCNVDADKQYQLADWRIRPLSDEMLRYAREDTHYLLYVYDLLRLQLLEKGEGQLQAVLDRSAQVSLRIYSKPSYDRHTYRRELAKRAERLSPTSEAIFARLHEWRDETARKFDESWPYVLPSYVMFRIAEQVPLSEAALADVARPLPPLVQHHAKEVVLMLQQVVAGISDPTGSVGASDAQLCIPSAATDDQLAPGQLSDIELYLLSASTAGPRQVSESPDTQDGSQGQSSISWFQQPTGHSNQQQEPALFGNSRVHASTTGSQTQAMETVQQVLSSFDSLDDMAKALLQEYTKSKMSAEAEESAQAEMEQQAAAGALLGAGAVNPVVSTQDGDAMVLEKQNAQKHPVEGTEEPDALDGERTGSDPVDPTSLPVSIAEKYDVRTSSGSRRRKPKGSRHKRRRAAAGAQPAEASPSTAAAPVFRGFSAGTEEPTYEESGAKSRGIRKNLQPRSHTMSSS
eukprot:COSAG02_NODE_948_length_15709_cov_67.728700_16_plen_711_part_00